MNYWSGVPALAYCFDLVVFHGCVGAGERAGSGVSRPSEYQFTRRLVPHVLVSCGLMQSNHCHRAYRGVLHVPYGQPTECVGKSPGYGRREPSYCSSCSA